MSDFKMGDLVEFIPENFDYPNWKYRLIGVGYIENIIYGTPDNIYRIYCGKVTKQFMKNFAEIEIKNHTFGFMEKEMDKLCRKLNSK